MPVVSILMTQKRVVTSGTLLRLPNFRGAGAGSGSFAITGVS